MPRALCSLRRPDLRFACYAACEVENETDPTIVVRRLVRRTRRAG